jgi:hypothetical protein
MTFSWGSAPPPPAPVDDGARSRLAAIADVLLPEAHGMPAASRVGVAEEQLDRVLHARPDLTLPLLEALAAVDPDAGEAALATLAEASPAGHGALVVVVLAGYYWSEQVKALLGYPGQTAAPVSTAFPAYVQEGLLDPVLERGEIYRRPPD